MRIAAFVYDFPHEKSVQGLLHLALADPDDVLVLAAPRVELPAASQGRPAPPPIGPVHPRRVAEALGHRYLVAPHESTSAALVDFGADYALVLGARILPDDVTSIVPVLNLHPGVVPDNRGLDAVPWAVLNDLPQGVTVHLIGAHIDGGPVLGVSTLPAVGDRPSVGDLKARIAELELRLMRELLLRLRSGPLGDGILYPPSELGTYHSRVPAEDFGRVVEALPGYAERYDRILAGWSERRSELADGPPLSVRVDTPAG